MSITHNFVNILIDSKHERFRDWELHKDSLIGAFIYVFSLDHFRGIIDSLPIETKIFVWIHLDGENNQTVPYGESLMKRLLDRYPNLEGSLFLITSDPNKTNATNDFGPFTQIQIDEVTHKNTPVSIKAIKQKHFPLARSVRYNKSKDDWILRDLFSQLDETTLSEILCHCLGDQLDFVVDMLSPGFSGALVLKITFQENNRERHRILKISRDINTIYSERNNDRLGGLEDKRILLTAINRKIYSIRDWFCLILSYSNKETLRSILRLQISREVPIEKSIMQAITAFRKAFYEEFSLDDNGTEAFFIKKLQPFSGGDFKLFSQELQYEGLKLSTKKKIQIVQIFHKQRIIHRSKKDKLPELFDSMEKIEVFLDKGHERGFFYNFEEKDLDHACTPVGYVHGDFHTANILSDEAGESLNFIDFAHVPYDPTRHAFQDLGKLSTDLEISIMPDGEFLYDIDRLLEWRKYHQIWMDPHAPLPDTDWLALRAIYETNEAIQAFIVEQFSGPDKLAKQEAIRQFYMVRLHYLLKAIAYDYEEREKILFFIMASADIISYLESDQP